MFANGSVVGLYDDKSFPLLHEIDISNVPSGDDADQSKSDVKSSTSSVRSSNCHQQWT